MLRSCWPHLLAIAHLPLLFLAGWAADNGLLGVYVGTAAAIVIRPLPLAVSVLLGVIIKRPAYLLGSLMLAGLPLELFVYVRTGAASPGLSPEARLSGMVTVAFATRLIASLITQRQDAVQADGR